MIYCISFILTQCIHRAGSRNFFAQGLSENICAYPDNTAVGMRLHIPVKQIRYINACCKRHQRMDPPGTRNKGSQHLLGSNIEIPRKKKYHVIGADKMIEYPYSSAFKDFGQRHAHTDPCY